MTPGTAGSGGSGQNNTDSVAKILCRICGDSAVRHVHYGGHCCFSCKAFFRRVRCGSKQAQYLGFIKTLNIYIFTDIHLNSFVMLWDIQRRKRNWIAI